MKLPSPLDITFHLCVFLTGPTPTLGARQEPPSVLFIALSYENPHFTNSGMYNVCQSLS